MIYQSQISYSTIHAIREDILLKVRKLLNLFSGDIINLETKHNFIFIHEGGTL